MNPVLALMWAPIALALLLFWGGSAAALASPQYYTGPGGQITGYVIGENGYPVDWALVNATDGYHSYAAFSGMSGMYMIWVPAGVYTVSVHSSGYFSGYFPGYSANSAIANVTNNSIVRVDFRLKQATVQVPELAPGLAPTVLFLTLGAVLVIKRRVSRLGQATFSA